MNAKQVLKGWAVRIVSIVVFASMFTIGVSAEDSSTNVVQVADTASCALAEQVYTGLAPVESLQGTCFQDYTALIEHDIDRGLTASAARASEGETLLETLLAKAAQNNVTYYDVWDGDLIDQIEHDIDAGFIPVNAAEVNKATPETSWYSSIPDTLPFDVAAMIGDLSLVGSAGPVKSYPYTSLPTGLPIDLAEVLGY